MQDEIKNIAKLREELRLSYANMLEVYVHFNKNYKTLKKQFSEEEMKKYFQLFEFYLYDETGNINWYYVSMLLPPNLEQSIKKEYNMLSEKEIRLCCLLLFDIPVKEIASLLIYKQKSIHSIVYKIKQKTGMKDIKMCLSGLLLQGY